MTTRRQFLQSAAAASGVAAFGAAGAPSVAAQVAEPLPQTGAHVVLLGTGGGPVPFAGRKGIATALVVDGRVYLVDAGHGLFDQYEAAGLTPAQLESAFITHLHSDHLSDLYTLLWLRMGSYNSFAHPIDVYGPGPAGELPPARTGSPPLINRKNPTPGISDFLKLSMDATAYDLNLRMRDEAWPDIREMVRAHDIAVPDVGAGPTGEVAPPMEPFEVMADDWVRVSAILVQHPPVFPSFAFRFDTAYGSVVISGDTTITQNMVTLARGADILVHEVIDLVAVEKFGNLGEEAMKHMRESHTDVTKIGALAQQSGVPTLVLSHLVPSTPAWSDAIWLANAQQGYTGKVIVGNDLMRVPLGVTG